MDSSLIVVVLVALVFGALGWWLGGRPVADWRARFEARDREARDLDEKFRRAITELAGAEERASRSDSLAEELGEARGEREALRAELARMTAQAENFAEQQRLLLAAQEGLKRELSLIHI